MIKEKKDKLDIFDFIKKDIWFDVKKEEKEDFKNFCNIAEVKQMNYSIMCLFEDSFKKMFDCPSLEFKTNDVDKINLPSVFEKVFLYKGATEEDIKTAINFAMWEAFYKTIDKHKAIILMANMDNYDYEKFANEIIKKVKDQIKNKNGNMLQKIKTINQIHKDIDNLLNSHIDEVTERNNPIFYKYIKEQGKKDAFEILKNKMKELKIDEITEKNKKIPLESALDEINTKINEYKEIGMEYEKNIRNAVIMDNNAVIMDNNAVIMDNLCYKLLHEIISEEQFLAIVEKTKKNCDIKTNKEHFFKKVRDEVDYITNNAERKIEDSTYTITCVSDKQSEQFFKGKDRIIINQKSKNIFINTKKIFHDCFYEGLDKENKLKLRPTETEADKYAIASLIKEELRKIAKCIKSNAGKNISQNKIIKIRFIGENYSRLIYNDDREEWVAADLIENLLETLLEKSEDKKIIIIDDSSCESKTLHVDNLLKNKLRKERIAKFLLKPEIKDKIQDLYIGSTLNGEQPEAEVMNKIEVDDKNKTIKSAKCFYLTKEELVDTLYVKKERQNFYQQQYNSLMTEPLKKEFEKNFTKGEISEDDLQEILTEVRGLDIEEARNKINEKIKQNNPEKNVQNEKKIANTEKDSNISIENIEQNKVEERQNNVDKEEMTKKIKEEFEKIKDKLPDLDISEEDIGQCVTYSNTTEEAIKEFHGTIAFRVLQKNNLMTHYENLDDAFKDGQLFQSLKQGQNCNYEYIVKQMVIASLKRDYVKYIEDKTINEEFIAKVVLRNIKELKNSDITEELENIKKEIMFQILKTRFDQQLKKGLLDEEIIEDSLKDCINKTIAIFPERIIVKHIIEQQCNKLNKKFKTALKEKLITEEEIKEKILKSENIEKAEQDIKKSIEVQKNKNEFYDKYEKNIENINIDKETIDKAIELAKDNDKNIDDIIKKEIKCNNDNFLILFKKFANKLEEKEIKQIIIKSNGYYLNALHNIQYKIKQNQIENKFKNEIEEGILDSNFIRKLITEDYGKDTSFTVKKIKDEIETKIETIKQVSRNLMENFKESIDDKIIDEKEIYKVILNNYNNENIEKITEACRAVIDNTIKYTKNGLNELRFSYDPELSMYMNNEIAKMIENIKLKAIKNNNNLGDAGREFAKIIEDKKKLSDKYRSNYGWKEISDEQIFEIVYKYDTNEEIEKHISGRINCNKLIEVYESEKYISYDKIKKIIQESEDNVKKTKQNIENEINKNEELLEALLEKYKKEINKGTITEESISEKFFRNIEDLKNIRTIINRDILIKEASQLRSKYGDFQFNNSDIFVITTDDLKQSRANIFYKLLKQIERAWFIRQLSKDDVISIGQKYSKFEEFYEAIVNYSLLEKMKNNYADIIEQGLIDIETIKKIIKETGPKFIDKGVADERNDNVMVEIQLSVAKKMFKNEIKKGLITEEELEEWALLAPIDHYEFDQGEEISFNPIKLNITRQIIANLYEKGDFTKSNILKAMEDFDKNKSIAENIKKIKNKYQQISKKNEKIYNELIEKYKEAIDAKNISKKEIKDIVENQCPEELNNEIVNDIETRKKTRTIQKSLKNSYAQKEMNFWNNFRKDLKTRPQINKNATKKSKSKYQHD